MSHPAHQNHQRTRSLKDWLVFSCLISMSSISPSSATSQPLPNQQRKTSPFLNFIQDWLNAECWVGWMSGYRDIFVDVLVWFLGSIEPIDHIHVLFFPPLFLFAFYRVKHDHSVETRLLEKTQIIQALLVEFLVLVFQNLFPFKWRKSSGFLRLSFWMGNDGELKPRSTLSIFW